MSSSHRSEKAYYDHSDGASRRNGSLYIQISLPSTRIEVPLRKVLAKKNGEQFEEVFAEDIKQHDLLMVVRDGIRTTEGVLEVNKVRRESLPKSMVEQGFIVVNNVLMK